MAALMRFYDWLIETLALLSGIAFGVMFLLIIYDVLSRTAGVMMITWVDAVSEYILLYTTALAAPWLLREKGHVCVEFVRAMVPESVRRVFEKLVYLIGLALSLIIVVFSVPVIEQSLGNLDIRAFEIPKWFVYIPMPIGFALMAVGFARFLFGGGTLYAPVRAGDEGF